MTGRKIIAIALCISVTLGTVSVIPAQDVAQLAMRARINLYETWNFDSVSYYLNRVIGKRYTPPFAYSDYGWYLMLLDQFDEGLAFIQKAAEMDSSDKQLAAWNAWALLWKGDLSSANQWIGKALALDPNDGEALYVSSLIASEMGNHQKAIKQAKRAAISDPNWRVAESYAYARAGEEEKALTLAKKIARNENVYDVMLLINVYGQLGDDDKALEYLEKAFTLKHPFMPWLKLVPDTKHLHHDTRFKKIVQRINLPR